MPDFIPRRDGDLLSFSGAFTAAVAEVAPALGIAPALIAQLQQAREAYAQEYQRARSPGTDSTTAIRGKTDAREALVRILRSIARMARAKATDEQRVSIGLRPGRAGKAALLPRPSVAPSLTLRRIAGRTLHMHICDVTGRAKPPGVTAALIFSFVGESAPDDLGNWDYRGYASRRDFGIDFPELPPGTKVWVIGQWVNPRRQPGPSCPPVYGHLGCGMQRLGSERPVASARG